MEGSKVRIGDNDYQCVGKCKDDWTFTPLNKDNEEVVILSDADISKMQLENSFVLLEE
ncbi:MAG: hypothetical protein ACOX3U_01930 [Christensenellales bacterium]|jgi:hypothetical protein